MVYVELVAVQQLKDNRLEHVHLQVAHHQMVLVLLDVLMMLLVFAVVRRVSHVVTAPILCIVQTVYRPGLATTVFGVDGVRVLEGHAHAHQDSVELLAVPANQQAGHVLTVMVKVFVAAELKAHLVLQIVSGVPMELVLVGRVIVLQGSVECLAAHVLLDRRKHNHAPDVLGLIIAPVGRRQELVFQVILGVLGALVLVVHAHVK